MRTVFSMVPLFLAFALTFPGFAAPGGPGFVPAVKQGRGALATSGVRALAASGGPGFVPASQQGRGALATSEVRSLAAPGGPGFVPAVQQGRGALATSGVRSLAAAETKLGPPENIPGIEDAVRNTCLPLVGG